MAAAGSGDGGVAGLLPGDCRGAQGEGGRPRGGARADAGSGAPGAPIGRLPQVHGSQVRLFPCRGLRLEGRRRVDQRAFQGRRAGCLRGRRIFRGRPGRRVAGRLFHPRERLRSGGSVAPKVLRVDIGHLLAGHGRPPRPRRGDRRGPPGSDRPPPWEGRPFRRRRRGGRAADPYAGPSPGHRTPAPGARRGGTRGRGHRSGGKAAALLRRSLQGSRPPRCPPRPGLQRPECDRDDHVLENEGGELPAMDRAGPQPELRDRPRREDELARGLAHHPRQGLEGRRRHPLGRAAGQVCHGSRRPLALRSRGTDASADPQFRRRRGDRPVYRDRGAGFARVRIRPRRAGGAPLPGVHGGVGAHVRDRGRGTGLCRPAHRRGRPRRRRGL